MQGVGFRPTVYRLAVERGLGGWIQNRAGAVHLCLQGAEAQLNAFIGELPARLPPPAHLARHVLLSSTPAPTDSQDTAFRIVASEDAGPADVVIPADLAMCPDCAREVLDPENRRYGYPFTTCTLCGPRYTVVNDMPYDRARTTMEAFPLCVDCRCEYDDPADRRFHAQSTACPVCGPRLVAADAHGDSLTGDPMQTTRKALNEGRIAAVRGIGGFLLAADAHRRDALARLRARKQRPHKPFAVMAPDLAVVRRLCDVPDAAADLLASPLAPIVILDTLPGARRDGGLPLDLISPDTDTLGIMLPTSPLHRLLFTPLDGDPTPAFDLLIMTSGNRGGEPICITRAEARERLDGIADCFLMHDREINLRNDDSVCVIRRGAPQAWRRARGYAPAPVALREPAGACVLAMGADMKNAVAVAAGQQVVLSPHIGDMDTPEARAGLKTVVDCLPRFLDRRPQCVAVDLHPDMFTTRFGETYAAERDLPCRHVQHHHAHAAACLAEHGLDAGLALTFDGTGLGTDGSIWGAELLHVTPAGFSRLATFAPVPLPGGDRAIQEPRRQLVARWHAAGIEPAPAATERLGLTPREVEAWTRQCERATNAPLTHGAGRLFDACAAALDLAPRRATYDGQAAIRLEAAARRAPAATPVPLPEPTATVDAGRLTLDWSPLFRRLYDDAGRTPPDVLALAVHHAIARAARTMVAYGFAVCSERTVALSGGVFMNRLLGNSLVELLGAMGAGVLLHRDTPPGDGCIALGQAVVAGRESSV